MKIRVAKGVLVLCVVLVVGTGVSMLVPRLFARRFINTKSGRTTVEMSAWFSGCCDFYVELKRHPKSLEELLTSDGSEAWDGPYVDAHTPQVDAWGHPYVFVPYSEGGKWWGILSLGSDGKPLGTKSATDIWFPPPKQNR